MQCKNSDSGFCIDPDVCDQRGSWCHRHLREELPDAWKLIVAGVIEDWINGKEIHTAVDVANATAKRILQTIPLDKI